MIALSRRKDRPEKIAGAVFFCPPAGVSAQSVLYKGYMRYAMNHKKILIPFAILGILLFASCSFGLMTAGSKDSKAIFSIALNSLGSSDSSVSRAIVQGSGYLYIRTIGGSSSSGSSFYGPYPVSAGASFSTADIPAGTYSTVGFFYSAVEIDESASFSYDGSEYSFHDLMRIDDAKFLALMDGDSDTKKALADSFGGNVSAGKVSNVTLTAGQSTSVAVVLTPFTGSSYGLYLPSAQSMTVSSKDSMARKFFRFDGLTVKSGEDITLTLTPSGSGAVIGIVAAYDGDGKLLASSAAKGAVTSAQTYTVKSTGQSSMFAYVEYRADSLAISVDGALADYLLSFSGGAMYANKTIYFGLYDVTGLDTTTESWKDGISFVALGIVNLDASGSGSGSARDLLTGRVVSLTPNKKYRVSAFMDINGNYTGYTDFSTITASVLSTMMPHANDLATDDVLPSLSADATGARLKCALSTSTMNVSTDYIYFVANSASGTGTGAVPANACTFATAIAGANTHSGASDQSKIILTGNISVSGSFSTLYDTEISTLGDSSCTISYGSTSTSINVTGNRLYLEKIILDGSGAGSLSASAVSAASGTTLIMKESAVQYMTAPLSTGVGIKVNAATLEMTDSLISHCTTTSAAGGGLYVMNTGAMATLVNTKIESCSASQGGGLAVATGGELTLVSSTITGCTAINYGGGMYLAAGTGKIINLAAPDGNTITLCQAPTGAGIYYSTGDLYLSAACSITQNTASTAGGGIYRVGATIMGSTAGVSGNTAPASPNVN